MLEESGLLNPEQLKMAMEFQKSVRKLGAIIVKAGVIENLTLTNFTPAAGIPVVNLDNS